MCVCGGGGGGEDKQIKVVHSRHTQDNQTDLHSLLLFGMFLVFLAVLLLVSVTFGRRRGIPLHRRPPLVMLLAFLRREILHTSVSSSGNHITHNGTATFTKVLSGFDSSIDLITNRGQSTHQHVTLPWLAVVKETRPPTRCH